MGHARIRSPPVTVWRTVVDGGRVPAMGHRIREIEPRDVAAVGALSLRGWACVFESMRAVMGERASTRLYPDWRVAQDAAVRDVVRVRHHAGVVGVDDDDRPAAICGGRPAGRGRSRDRHAGRRPVGATYGPIGAALTAHAVDWMRDRSHHDGNRRNGWRSRARIRPPAAYEAGRLHRSKPIARYVHRLLARTHVETSHRN